MTTLFGLLGLFIVLAGSALLSDLGAGRLPHPIRLVANVWVRAGYDRKWITVAMWVVFATMVFVLALLIGIPLYHSVVDLGTPRR